MLLITSQCKQKQEGCMKGLVHIFIIEGTITQVVLLPLSWITLWICDEQSWTMWIKSTIRIEEKKQTKK